MVKGIGDGKYDLDEDGHIDSLIADNLYAILALKDSKPVCCDTDIKVIHSNAGTLSAALKGGTISGEFYQTVQVKQVAQNQNEVYLASFCNLSL